MIIVFAVGVSKIIISQLSSTGFTQASNAAYYAAEAGLEVVLLKLKNKEIGWNLPTGSFDLPIEDDSGETGRVAKITYKVKSNVDQLKQAATAYKEVKADTYLVPSPWLGNAASTPCSSEVPPVPDNFSTISADNLLAAALEHPCNWNKLAFGQTVTLPLYSLAAAKNNTPINPSAGGINSLTLKMRTPCKTADLNPENFTCAGARYVLDYDLTALKDLKDTKIATDDTVVNWQINAEDGKGGIVSLLADDTREKTTKERKEKENSEIYESKIMAAMLAKTYQVIKDSVVAPCAYINYAADWSYCGGKDVDNFKGGIMTFLKQQDQQKTPDPTPVGVPNWSTVAKIRPVLKLTVIHPLIETSTLKNIPYLEYQLLTDKPIASNVQVVEVEAELGGFKQAIQIKRPVESSVLEFTVHN